MGENTRNNHLKELRTVFKDDSRFYQGKNKLTQIALGRTEEEETLTGLHKVSQLLIGEVGLLFTDKSAEDVVKYFNSFNPCTRPARTPRTRVASTTSLRS